MIKPRAYFFWSVGAILGLLLLAAALVAVVDPLVHYRAPGVFKLQFSAKNALRMIPGVLRHMPHDSVLVGDSMLINADLADVRELLGWDAVKATAGGSWPAATSRFMDIAFEAGAPRNILLNLQLQSHAYPADQIQFPLEPYLYEPRPWRELQYWWNRDILTGPLFHALQVTLGGGSKKYRQRASLDTMFASNLAADEHLEYGESILRAWHASKPPAPPRPAVTTVEGMMAGLDTNLLRHIRAHRETRFELVLPPNSKIYWHAARQRENWGILLDFHAAALAALIAEPNARVHDCQTVRHIVCDLDNYKDSVHHKPSINRWVLERVAAADRVMATNDIPAFLEAVTRLGDATNQPPWVLGDGTMGLRDNGTPGHRISQPAVP